jgi:alpha-L-fucosidase
MLGLAACLNLNALAVGTNVAPNTVRFVYLVSADREMQPQYVGVIKHAARDVRAWYAKQLGGMTFELAEPVVEILHSDKNAEWFTTHTNGERHDDWGFNNTLAELKRLKNVSPNKDGFVWVIYSDGPGHSGRAYQGYAYLPEDDLLGLIGKHPTQPETNRWIAGLGHELGHALGLPHPADKVKDKDAIMWAGIYHGKYPDKCYLTDDDKKILAANPVIQNRAARSAAANPYAMHTNASTAAQLASVRREAAAGPFQPDWDSLAQFQVPEWYRDAKFGIFIHWGVYSVPAFGHEWYPREMYDREGNKRGVYQHHLANYGALTNFGYKDFIPMFKAEKFNPAAWAKLFKQAGAKYVVPVAEHHDGFAMYDSDLTEWNSVKLGPKRDLIGELSKAIRGQGLIFGLSSHRAENCYFYGLGRSFESDVTDARYRGLYGELLDRDAALRKELQPSDAFMQDWLLRSCELVDKYQPQLFWFDGGINMRAMFPYQKQFSAYYYNRAAEWKKGVAINFKHPDAGSFPPTAGVLDIERGQMAGMAENFWQTDTAVAKFSWGYITNQDYKTVGSLVDDLVDIVSKNGCLLLNIGPKADGTIPDHEQEMLRDIGRWLKLNGEAIYSTRPWKVYGEGPTQIKEGPMAERQRKGGFTAEDIRFTQSKDGQTIYATLLDWPANGAVTIKSLADGQGLKQFLSIKLLGNSGKLTWTRNADGLTVALPTTKPCDYAFVLKFQNCE